MRLNLARELDMDKTSKVVQPTLEASEGIAVVFVVSRMTDRKHCEAEQVLGEEP